MSHWHAAFPWTVEQVETLRTMWADGHTASEISKHFGGAVSRSGVIGKVNRLGLQRRIDRSWKSAPADIAPRAQGKSEGGLLNKLRRSAAAKVRAETPKVASASALAPEPDAGAPNTGVEVDGVFDIPSEMTPTAVTLAEIGPDQCRYPLGNPGSAEFRFCGGPKRSQIGAYCDHHHAITHRPAPLRVMPDEQRHALSIAARRRHAEAANRINF